MRAYAIILMQAGQPAADMSAVSFCLGAHHGDYGMYLVAGTGAALTALAGQANVWRICTWAELDNSIGAARRTAINNWLSARGWPNIPAGMTYRQVVAAVYRRANPAWDEGRHQLRDE
jgi:hypothetical protein